MLSAFILGAIGCTGGSTALHPAETAEDPAPVNRSCAGLPNEPFTINTLSIDAARILRMSVTHFGGCEDHTFAACWDGAISKSNPSTITLTFAHDDHDDACDGVITRDVFVDLSHLPAGFAAPVRGEVASTVVLTTQP
jgi:hypothetical protein